MNKIVVFIIILIGFAQVSFAQVQFKDSTEAHNYWAKRSVIEATYAYMQDYIITIRKEKAKDELIGKEKYFEQFLKDIDSQDTLPEFDRISVFLKENSWSGAEKTLFKPLKKNFEDRVPLDFLFFKCTKPGSNDLITVIPGHDNNNVNWDRKTNELIQGFNNSLIALSNHEKKLIDSNSDSIPSEGETAKTKQQQELQLERNQTQHFWQAFLVYVSIFIISLLIGFTIGNLWIKNQVKKRIKKILKDEINEDNLGYTFLRDVYKIKKDYELKSKNLISTDEFKRKTSQLEKEKEDFLRQNIELGKKLELEKIKKNRDQAEGNGDNLESFISQQPTKKIVRLFFSMPETNGSFLVSNGEYANDGKKYFRIEFEESGTKGELFYLSGDRDERAINRLDSYLKPVCDIENITSSSSATKIELIHSGKVNRLNDYWIIDPDNRLKIRLH